MKFTYLTLTLLVPTVSLSMEMQQVPARSSEARQSNELLLLDLEEGNLHNDASRLSADLVSNIKAGKVSHINQLLTQRKNRNVDSQLGTAKNVDQLVSALGYTQGELELQQQQMAQGLFDHFMARYKQAAIPAFLTLASAANLITNAVNYANQSSAPVPGVTQQTVGSFAINMTSSSLAVIGFGYKTIKEVRKAVLDTRQKKAVDALKNSQLLLQLLHEAAMKDGVITAQEQVGIDAAHTALAEDQADLAQVQAEIAVIAAQEKNAAGKGVAHAQSLAFEAPAVLAKTPSAHPVTPAVVLMAALNAQVDQQEAPAPEQPAQQEAPAIAQAGQQEDN